MSLVFPFRIAATAALVALAACSGTVPAPAPHQFWYKANAAPLAVPKACTGQKTTAKFALLATTLQSAGGTACIPAIAGFGGTVLYPTVSPSISLRMTSSATNYNGRLPLLAKGNAVFYLQLATSAGVTFGASVPSGGGLTGAALVPGKPYTAFGKASIQGFSVGLTPCYATATKGKYGGVVAGFGRLLAGQQVPAAASGIIEIYAGKRATAPC